MDPWYIIGWLFLGVCAVAVGLAIALYGGTMLYVWWRWRRTAKIAPEVGQIWRPIHRSGTAIEGYYITRVTADMVRFQTLDPRLRFVRTNISVPLTPAEWQRHVAKKLLCLVSYWQTDVTTTAPREGAPGGHDGITTKKEAQGA